MSLSPLSLASDFVMWCSAGAVQKATAEPRYQAKNAGNSVNHFGPSSENSVAAHGRWLYLGWALQRLAETPESEFPPKSALREWASECYLTSQLGRWLLARLQAQAEHKSCGDAFLAGLNEDTPSHLLFETATVERAVHGFVCLHSAAASSPFLAASAAAAPASSAAAVDGEMNNKTAPAAAAAATQPSQQSPPPL
jgi:hypothetical protein